MTWVLSKKQMNKTISHLPGVRAAVADEALEIGVRAEAKLLRHRDWTNKTNHEIEVNQGRKAVDSFVSLVGPAPKSVEFGHWWDNGEIEAELRYIPGLYIITGAAGLLG